jgi:CP family cyanate transporter-like MFS transporter
MFALAAVPGSLLIARFGTVLIAGVGLLTSALAAGARAVVFEVWTLYAATVVMGFGIAIAQPALPALARAWAPNRVGLATAVTTNGLLVGVALGPALTIPFVLPLVGGNWRLDLLVWAAPGLAAALLCVAAAPRLRAATRGVAVPRRWWPDWNSATIWLLGLTFGSSNALFYGANAFVPDYLNSAGRGDLIGLTLAWLNGSQLVASFVLLLTAEHLQRRTWPFTVFGPLSLAGVLGVAFCDGIWIVLSAAVIGFAAAVTFVVTFALPPILSPPDDVHRMAGGMFTISYALAVAIPILCGAFWDLSGVSWTAFAPLGLCGLGLTVFGTVLSRKGARR